MVTNRNKLINALAYASILTPQQVEEELRAIATEVNGRGILNDVEIAQLATEQGMIEPYEPTLVRMVNDQRVISFGQSSFGYDITVADEFQIFTSPLDKAGFIDPKDFDPKLVTAFKGKICVIPAHGFALARTEQYFRIPQNVITICLGKSTYARTSLILNVTPFEPGWEGYATLEISNTSPLPAYVYANEGIGQLLFFEGRTPTTTYNARPNRYQGQVGIVHASV